MIWANLAMLGVGGVMLSVPVLIHFLMKPKPIEVDFPALRFLQEKSLVSKSRSRLRHFLLLLLRCLLIGLAALALAGPAVASQQFGKWLTFGGMSILAAILGLIFSLSLFSGIPNKLLNGVLGVCLAAALLLVAWSGWQLFDDDSSGQLTGDSGDPVSALIVLDTSPTMQYELNNETRLTKAKSIATWLVQQFPAGSQICISAPDGDRAFFSVDQGAANRRIESLPTCFNPLTIPETIAESYPLVEDSPLVRKEVYLISDLTRKGWSPATDPAVKRLIDEDSTSLFVVDVGVEEPVDFRVDSVSLSQRQLTSESKLAIKANINRLGDAAQRNVQLTVEQPDKTLPVISNGTALFPDKAWTLTNLVDVFENGSSSTEFQFQESLPPGTYHGKVEVVGGDPLAIDDKQFFTFEVSSPWRALVVRPEGTDASFLESVLASSGSFEAVPMNQVEFLGVNDLQKYAAVFLVDPQPIGEEAWLRLSAFVDQGGGLGVFLGHNAADRDGFPQPDFQTDAASRVLSGRLSNLFRCPDRIRDPFVLSPQSYVHPILSAFREVSTSVPWARYPVFNFWGLESDGRDDEFPTSDVVLYNNFEPAIIQRRIGSGRVVVMTTPISEAVNLRGRKAWNQRPLRPFVWFVVARAITRFVVQADSESLDVGVGDFASLRNDLTKFPDTWNVFSPDPLRPPAKVGTVNNRINYGNIDMPGHYRFKGTFDGPVLRGFSANIDTKTVDLTRATPEEIDKAIGAGRYQLAKDQDEIVRQQGQARKGREFYPLLVLLMFAAMVIEYLVSNRFYRS